jgi:protein phosphatase
MSSELSQEEVQAKGYVRSVSGTHVGMRREENQDSHLIFESEHGHCLIVADGMGGAQGGAVASNMALEVFQETLLKSGEINEETISAAIAEANRRVYSAGTSDPTLLGMGTTFVGLCFVGHSVFLFNVGDSRIYRIREGKIKALTEDHTLIMDLIRSGAISPDQADNHPVSHMLTRSLGPAEDVVPDCWLCEDGPARGDRYIICSDGLYNMVSEVVMLRIARENPLDVVRDECIRLANENGGTDNITVIALEIGENFPVGPEEYSTLPDIDTEEDTIEFRINRDDAQDGIASGDGSALNGEEAGQSNGSLGEGDELASDSPEIAGSISLEVKRTFGMEEDESDVQDEGGETDDIDSIEAVVEDVQEAELNDPQSGEYIAGEDEPQSEESLSHEVDQEEEYEVEPLPSSSVFRSRPMTLLLVFCFGVAATLCTGIIYQYMQRLNRVSMAPGQTAQVKPKRTGGKKSFNKKPVAGQQVKNNGQDGTDAAQGSAGVVQKAAGSEKQAKIAPIPTTDTISQPAEQKIGGLSLARAESVSKRKRYIRKRIQTLEQRLETFEKPLSGGIGERLVRVRRELDDLRSKQKEAQGRIEEASRSVTLWYGRQRRLQNTDHVSLASEIAETTPEVKKAKDDFEGATWEYLKKAEALRYDADNAELKAEVEALTSSRKESLKALRVSVGSSINREAEASQTRLNALTKSRDATRQKVLDLEEDLRYLKALTGQDKETRSQLKKEFFSQLEVARSELSELDQILPKKLELPGK